MFIIVIMIKYSGLLGYIYLCNEYQGKGTLTHNIDMCLYDEYQKEKYFKSQPLSYPQILIKVRKVLMVLARL